MTRKRRTRQHVLEDLSFNHVERFVLQCGWSVQRQDHDYGIDLTIHTYDHYGEIQNGYVNVQLKATDRLALDHRSESVLLPIERSDLEYWVSEPFPVILIRFDGRTDQAYWLHIQEHFGYRFDSTRIGKTVTVRMPVTNRLAKEAILEFARRKDLVLKRFEE